MKYWSRSAMGIYTQGLTLCELVLSIIAEALIVVEKLPYMHELNIG